MKCVAFCNCSGKHQISNDCFILFDQRYKRYLNSVWSKVNFCISDTGENKELDTLENQLLTFVKSIM